MECAAAGDGIRVNTVHPGVINTPIWTKIPASAGSNAPIDPNEIAKAGYRSWQGWASARYRERCAIPLV
jgi:NAD(P)-dependent dehydrogenase (short-subunit alcohol dehydrogenase family)